MIRDNESIAEWLARVQKEDDALPVAALFIAFLVVAGFVGLAIYLRGVPLH